MGLSLLREIGSKKRKSWGGRSLDILESEREMKIRFSFQSVKENDKTQERRRPMGLLGGSGHVL